MESENQLHQQPIQSDAIQEPEKAKALLKLVNNLLKELLEYSTDKATKPTKKDEAFNHLILNIMGACKGIPQAGDNKEQKAVSLKEFKVYIRIAWDRIKNQLDGRQRYEVGWYLTAIIWQIYGNDNKCRLDLPYPVKRRLVYDPEFVIAIGMDNAHQIIDRIRFSMTPKSLREALGMIIIEMLWQGIPFKDAVKIAPSQFDPDLNAVFIKAGRTYRISAADNEFWLRFAGLSRRANEWFWLFKKNVTIEKYFPKRQAYTMVNGLLKHAAELCNINTNEVNQNNFHHAAIAHKIMVDGIEPATISACFGPELQTNVVSLSNIYDIEYINEKTKDKHNDNIHEIAISEPAHKEFFEELSRIRGVMAEYCKERDRNKAITSLEKILANTNVRYIIDWLISIFKHPIGKKYSYATLERYMSDVQKVFVYCEVNGIRLSDLDEDDVLEIACPYEIGSNKKELMINANTYKTLKIVVGKLIEYMKSKNMDAPDIRWDRLDRYVDNSPRMLFMPDIKAIDKRISDLANKNMLPEAVVGIMAFYLGMRKKEIRTARTTGVRAISGDSGYIEVIGKGSKLRRIPLVIIPDIMRKILMKLWNDAICCKRDTILPFVSESTIDTVFKKCWHDLSPDGLHSLRHSFATRHLLAGEDQLRVASWMGHNSFRVLQNTYDQGIWKRAKQCSDVSNSLSGNISQANVANFLSMTPERVFILKNELSDKANDNKWRKKLTNEVMDKLISKYKNIRIGKRERLLTNLRKSEVNKVEENMNINENEKEALSDVEKIVEKKRKQELVNRTIRNKMQVVKQKIKKAHERRIVMRKAVEEYLITMRLKWNWRTRSRNRSILMKWISVCQKEKKLGLDGLIAYSNCKEVASQISDKKVVQKEYRQVLFGINMWLKAKKYTHLTF